MSGQDAGDGWAEKLVRDRIPDIIMASGRRPVTRTARDDGEYAALLRAKLREEAAEYAAGGEVAELADVLEVVRALAAAHGVDPADLEEMRAAKSAERGGFAARIVLRSPAPRRAPGPPGEPARRVRQAARALLLDGADLVLFRRTRPGQAPYWSTPGGKIEPADAGPEAALRRELSEELGATVGAVRQVFACAEESPGLRRVNTFYVCRLGSMDLARRHGAEFGNPAKGRYDLERVPCTAAALDALPIVPAPLAGYLHAHAAELPGLVKDGS